MRVLGVTLLSGKKQFCDARCHNSTKRHCDCICGGLLHGKGNAYAKLYAYRVQHYVHRSGAGTGGVWLNPELVPQPRD